jgi:peptidoglycan-associated lipoprotein
MKTPSTVHLLGCLVIGVAVLGATGCNTPKYPDCDTDEQCKAQKEFCINKKCQQCRNDTDCGDGQTCNAGRCTQTPGYCKDASQCEGGQICVGNHCQACAADGQCPSGLKCVQGGCMKPECMKDDDCRQDQECKGYRCISAAPKAKVGPPCPLASVYFDLDKSTLSPAATGTLAENATCLKKADSPVNLLGRADARGTPEYNMALSDRRAQAVKDYLQRAGIPANRLITVPRGELDASGTDDASWAKDRRVDSEWQ